MNLDIQKILILMARKGINQGKLAKAMSCAQSWISALFARIREGREVNPETAGNLANALGVDVTEIMQSNDRADGKAA